MAHIYDIIYLHIGTLCDPDPLLKENALLKEELLETKRHLQKEKWGVHKIKDNDSLTKFYTSLPTFAMFLWLFDYVKDKCERMTYWTGESHTVPGLDRTRSRMSHLQPIDQLFAVLMRNRLGLFVQDIADRFCIAPSTFSKYYTTWLCLLHKELQFLNPFPATTFTIKEIKCTILEDCKINYDPVAFAS